MLVGQLQFTPSVVVWISLMAKDLVFVELPPFSFLKFMVNESLVMSLMSMVTLISFCKGRNQGEMKASHDVDVWCGAGQE